MILRELLILLSCILASFALQDFLPTFTYPRTSLDIKMRAKEFGNKGKSKYSDKS